MSEKAYGNEGFRRRIQQEAGQGHERLKAGENVELGVREDELGARSLAVDLAHEISPRDDASHGMFLAGPHGTDIRPSADVSLGLKGRWLKSSALSPDELRGLVARVIPAIIDGRSFELKGDRDSSERYGKFENLGSDEPSLATYNGALPTEATLQAQYGGQVAAVDFARLKEDSMAAAGHHLEITALDVLRELAAQFGKRLKAENPSSPKAQGRLKIEVENM
jgi:hypothetical protein